MSLHLPVVSLVYRGVRFPHPNSKGKSGNKVTPQHSEMSKLLKGNQENSSTGLVADFEVWCKSLSAFP